MKAAAFFREAGFTAFSLTEHDTLSSLDAAREAAESEGVEFVPGIEMGVSVDDPDLPQAAAHVLGFLFERTPELESLAQRTCDRQTQWVSGGLDRLREKGAVNITEEELRDWIRVKFGPDDVWKRPFSVGPVGDLLRQRGILPEGSGNNGVRKLLDEIYPRSELPPLPDIEEASRVLAEAGAVRALAHPGGGKKTPTEDEQGRLSRWLDAYVDGVEVYTPKHSPEYRAMALSLCRSRSRPYSGGSDRHSYNPGDRSSDAPYACVESLREFQAR